MDAILWHPKAEALRQGIRRVAYLLNERRPTTRVGNRAVYLAHGQHRAFVPNQYFVPGMFSPMPLMGKYYVYYGSDLLATKVVGRHNVERIIGELPSDNAGMCRFHRQWDEPMAGLLLTGHRGVPDDYPVQVTRLAAEILAAAEAASVPWEMPRLVELFRAYWRWQRERGSDLAPVANFFAPEVRPGKTIAETVDWLLATADLAAWRTLALRSWETVRTAQRQAMAEAVAALAAAPRPSPALA